MGMLARIQKDLDELSAQYPFGDPEKAKERPPPGEDVIRSVDDIRKNL